MQRAPLEKEIQLAICDYLALRRHFFWRQNTGGMYDPTKGVMRAMPKHSMAGIPDIIVVRGGQFIGLEVKRVNKNTQVTKQNSAQILFEAGCTKAGGQYHVVRSVDDVIKIGL